MIVDESMPATIFYLGATTIGANGSGVVQFQCDRNTGPRQKNTYSDDGDQDLFGKYGSAL